MPKHLKRGVVPTIPRGADPERIEESSWLPGVACPVIAMPIPRPVSRHPAWGWARLAACTAVLAAKSSTTPKEVPLGEIHSAHVNMGQSYLRDPFFDPTKSSFMRRSFLKTTSVASVAFAALNLLTAKSKKALVLGKGEFQYTVEHGWGKLPENHIYGNASHGVAIDKAGLIYVTHTGKPGSLFVFDRRANGSRPWAKSTSDADMA